MTRLTEAVQKYTNLDITTPAGLLYLHVQFISQSAPDIRRKLRQLEKGPEIPQRDLLEVAFKVFNNTEEEAKRKKNVREKLHMPLWWQQLKEEISLAQVIPDQDLRPPPTALNPASDAASQDTGQRMPEPMAPHKSVPNLWSMGRLEDGLSPGMPWHPWGGPHLPDLESGMSTGMP